jgi:hypothetical protein
MILKQPRNLVPVGAFGTVSRALRKYYTRDMNANPGRKNAGNVGQIVFDGDTGAISKCRNQSRSPFLDISIPQTEGPERRCSERSGPKRGSN